LNDKEMAALNREVANKIYSFLQIMFNPHYVTVGTKALEWLYVSEWDKPVFDKSFVLLLECAKRKRGR
jgi:hypothetical protein